MRMSSWLIALTLQPDRRSCARSASIPNTRPRWRRRRSAAVWGADRRCARNQYPFTLSFAVRRTWWNFCNAMYDCLTAAPTNGRFSTCCAPRSGSLEEETCGTLDRSRISQRAAGRTAPCDDDTPPADPQAFAERLRRSDELGLHHLSGSAEAMSQHVQQAAALLRRHCGTEALLLALPDDRIRRRGEEETIAGWLREGRQETRHGKGVRAFSFARRSAA